MALEQGATIGGYRVGRLIGSGGMSEVYEVVHEQLRSSYALKLFTLEDGNVAFLRERFLAEARAMNRLRDPGIVRVYDLGSDDHGRPYLVMDLMVDDAGMPSTLESRRRKGGLSEEKIHGWYIDLREALKVVHEAGIVHRDLKPVNVLLDAEGRAVISDFGIARYDGAMKQALAVENTFVTGQNTSERPVFGTAVYLAPEVLRGEPATPSSDLYSLGVTVLKLLTGISYEKGVDIAMLLKPFSPVWMDILPALLSEEPACREQASCRAFVSGIEQDDPSARLARRRGIGWVIAAAALLFLSAGIAFLFLFPGKTAPAESAPAGSEAERGRFFDEAFAVDGRQGKSR